MARLRRIVNRSLGRTLVIAWLFPCLGRPSLGPVSTQYLDLGPGGAACCLVTDPAGNLYVAGSVVRHTAVNLPDVDTDISVSKLDRNLKLIYQITLGGGKQDVPLDIAIDKAGNLFVVGRTASNDFPSLNSIFPTPGFEQQAAFVVKIEGATGRIQFSMRIGSVVSNRASSARAVAVDPSGNVYVAGYTDTRDFPTTPNAFQRSAPGGDAFGIRDFAFVIKMSGLGDKVFYSTLLGAADAYCPTGGSHCIGIYGNTSAIRIVVSSDGIATVAGITNSPHFPVTAGALQSTCRCQDHNGQGFVSQLNSDGSALRWSTFWGGSLYEPSIPYGETDILGLALDPNGNVIIAGLTDTIDLPTTSEVIQPRMAGPTLMLNRQRRTDGFLSKLKPDGSGLVFSTYLGGVGSDRVGDVFLTPQGSVWVTGATDSLDFPSGADLALTGSYIAEVAPDGTRFLFAERLPNGSVGARIALTADDRVIALGATGWIAALSRGVRTTPVILGVAGSLESTIGRATVPGDFLSIFGADLGPRDGVGASINGDGRIATELAGTQVFFDGVAAPLLYVGGSQINVLVPYGVADHGTTEILVRTPAGDAAPATLLLTAAKPGVVRTYVNEDGTINSLTNPAASGSIVTIYLVGSGVLDSAFADGSIAGEAPAKPVLPVTLAFTRTASSVEILYAGTAPGLVVNALQIKFRVVTADFLISATYQVAVGDTRSELFSIFVTPPR